MNANQMIDLLTIREAAEVLRISVAAAYELTKSGRLPCYRLGAKGVSIRISRQDLLNYLECSRQSNVEALPVVRRKHKLKHLRA